MKFLKEIESLEDNISINKLVIDCLDIIKSCTENDAVLSIFNNCTLSNKIIYDVVNLYENTDLINQDNKEIFIQGNAIFSNLCKSPEGFSSLIDKIGLERMLTIAKNTGDVEILSAIMQALIGYMQTQGDVSDIIGDILTIIAKCFSLPNKNQKLMTNCNLLSGLAYNQDLTEYFDQIGT